jgi:hypothetical protein
MYGGGELSYIHQRHKENAVKSQVEDKSCEKSQGRSAFTVSSPPYVKYQDVQMEDALGCRFRDKRQRSY